MKHLALTLFAALFLTVTSYADEYEKTCSDILNKVKKGETAVDYAALRLNCARTSWYVKRKQTKIDKIRKEMYAAANEGKHAEVKKLAQSILDLNYLNMTAHRMLSWSFKALGDSVESKRHLDIELGLLRSIGQSGSGKNCKEGRIVIDVEEEYFVMQVMGWKLKRQRTVSDGDITCDLMEVVDSDGNERREYFNVNIVFENYRRNYK
ncbi:DUF4919 domain-containing protein [Fibrobacter sp.]